MIGDRWGVTDEEVARSYPCDGLLPGPGVAVWRGVTIEASAAEVWRWLRQVRLAPYSYDWLDNLGWRSPRELRDVPDPVAGAPFTCLGGRLPVGRVLAVVPGESLTASIMGATMSYVLAPHDRGTRLLLKIVIPRGRWYARPVALGDWPMARRQLLNFKALAERQR